jgi:carboxyl-terminal processing protease
MGKLGLAPFCVAAALCGCVLFTGEGFAGERGSPAVGVASSATPSSAPPSSAPGDPAFASDTLLAEALFSTVYRAIAERYLDPVAVQTLALEGLVGLTAIDPALTISREGGSVAIAADKATLMRFDEPRPGDARGWASLSANIVGMARRTSKAVAAADDEQIYETVIDRALTMLDRFSRYFSPHKADDHRARRRGSGDIGIEFLSLDDRLIITKLLPNSSALKAGLRVGDHLSRIDGVDVARLTTEQISARLRGKEGSAVTVVVKRGDQRAFPVRVQRTRIIPATVVVRRFDDILYVAIKSFNRDTPRSLADALQDPSGRAYRGIVLDLRGNPGGLLQQSVSVADLFLNAGTIVSTSGRHPDSLQSYEAGDGDVARGRPLVVLVDGGSASGSEVVAAALAEQGRAVLVGTASYGKGTVQTVVPLPNDGELILTWSRMISPSGQTLNEKGVVPALCTSGIEQADPAALNRLVAILIARAIEKPTANRNDCPAERHEHDVDIEVARKLLGEPALFAKLAAIRPKPAQLFHRAQLDTVTDHVMVARPLHNEPPM